MLPGTQEVLPGRSALGSLKKELIVVDWKLGSTPNGKIDRLPYARARARGSPATATHVW